jgi:GTP cyclohydrolase IA
MNQHAAVAAEDLENDESENSDMENIVELRGVAGTSTLLSSPREIDPDDWTRLESHVAEILSTLGMDLETPGTRETPRRFLRALYDATAGYEGDPKLLTAFPTECRCDADCLVSQVIEGPISFYSLCEHHALPFHGFAHVGYVAHERIIGISKLTRLVRLFSRRFTVQERLGEQIADALADLMEPHGVAVHLEAVHLCTQMRGVREEHSKTVTRSATATPGHRGRERGKRWTARAI